MLALSSSRCAAFSATTRVQQARPVAFITPSRTALVVEAAVPKKRVSKSKTAIRKAAWKKEVLPYVEIALFKAKAALKDGSRQSKDKDMAVAAPAAEETTTSQEGTESQ